MRTQVASTSIDAYHSLGPKLGEQQRRILSFMRLNPSDSFTRAELAEWAGLRVSSVCGRAKELVDMGLLEELPRRPCRVTKINAHPLRVRPCQAQLFN